MREIQRYTRDANAKLSGGWGLFLAASFRDYCHGGGEVCGKTSIKTEVECFKWRGLEQSHRDKRLENV